MDRITLNLSARAYNLIVQAVQELPWKLAQPVFNEIDPQVQAALDKESSKPTPPVQPEAPEGSKE